jgi:hypothetical protein
MVDKLYFGILPYLRTTSKIVIRGITFWPSQDIEKNQEIDEDCKTHLRLLFPMFFQINDIPISNMTFTCVHVEDNPGNPSDSLSRLREACILIGYIYLKPFFPTGRPFLLREHADLYLFHETRVSKSLLGQTNEDIPPSEKYDPQKYEVAGYEGLLNWHSYFWVANGSKIYPSLPDIGLNKSQDIYSDFKPIEYRPQIISLQYLINGKEEPDKKTLLRIFTALEWYNGSCSGQISEEVALVHLATAFECLFSLPSGPDLTQRFKEAVILLLGRVPRLDSWIDQFYTARSKVLHEGYWPHMAFYAVDSDAYKEILKGKHEGVVYRSLVAYGRRIFRMCLDTIYLGALASEKSGLASSFVHNQERLETICHILSLKNIEPIERLRQVSKHILDLDEFWIESEDITNIKTVIGTGLLLIKVLLDSAPQLPNDVEQSLLSICNIKSDLSEYNQLSLFKKADVELSIWKREGISYGILSPNDPIDIVHRYIKYASMPGFFLQVR